MLDDAPCKHKKSLKVDGLWVGFSLASEGTKVSMPVHALHALLGLKPNSWETMVISDSGQFCSQGNLFSDSRSPITEADITPT